MAAATVESHSVVVHGGMITQKTVITTMTSDTVYDIPVATTYGAPNKTAPFEVYGVVTVAPTSGSVSFFHIVASDVTASNTVAVKVNCTGTIGSAKAEIVLRWLNIARQDGQSISSDNNS